MEKQLSVQTISDELCEFAGANLLADGVALKPHDRLSGAGLDSFSLVELLLFCERRFGAAVPESLLTHENLESIDTLARCVFRLINEINEKK